ncbi:hypothetical protein GH714_000920 [Hevea brasiliensis]|uniref:Auxin efflux carrier component n=1 Tax=Hevea brasiliensis TaxID=3981 RepID=A0A6A6MB07_HEVBR|nr:hypothetical protein GH714_000920 [Hevea brasiliensis]
MITGKNIYDVLAALVPLYVAMILAYGSVRWWKIFTPDQCSGINRFVAVFAVPLLSFHFISSNNPYAMNYSFIAADSLQKVVILVALFLWQAFSKRGSLEWMITSSPLYPSQHSGHGNPSFESHRSQVIHFRPIPETAGSITSFRVDSDVVSLNGREPLQTETEIGEDGKLHVVVRRSSTSSMMSSFNKSHGLNSLTSMNPRASNLTGVEIYSVQSSREPTPRASSFNQTQFHTMFASKAASPKHGYTNSFLGAISDDYSLQSSKGATPRTSNFDEDMLKIGKRRGGRTMSVNKAASTDFEGIDSSKVSLQHVTGASRALHDLNENMSTAGKMNGEKELDIEDGQKFTATGWGIQMPSIVKGSISILSDTGLGMAMFSLGLFMALQPKMIACGKYVATFAMAVRFLTGPAVIAATSSAIGLRGPLLHVAIVQAALPQGIVPFVFAKEYNVHPGILGTAVIFGMLIALPITILYYVLLGL